MGDGVVSVADLLAILRDAGIIGLLVVILVGGMKQPPWWVWGWLYRRKEEECEEWKRLALSTTSLAETLARLEGRKQ